MILWHSSHFWSCWWSMRQLACPLATPILPGAAAIAGQRQGMQHLLGGFGVSWWNWWSTSFASWCRLVQIWAWVMGITWHYKLFLPPFRWCSLDFDKGATHSVPPSFLLSFLPYCTLARCGGGCSGPELQITNPGCCGVHLTREIQTEYQIEYQTGCQIQCLYARKNVRI